MKEKVIIAFIATIAGLLLTTLAFSFYRTAQQQGAKSPKSPSPTARKEQPTPKPTSGGKIFLTVDSPEHESIQNKKTLRIQGKTNVENVVIFTLGTEDIVETPSQDGDFTASVNLEEGTHLITTVAIAPNGESIRDERVVTYTQEEF